jgi:hypothetical protein
MEAPKSGSFRRRRTRFSGAGEMPGRMGTDSAINRKIIFAGGFQAVLMLRHLPSARMKTAGFAQPQALISRSCQRFIGRCQLTPLYDVMSAFPAMGDGPDPGSPREPILAMTLIGKNRNYIADRIQRRHFNSTARHVSFGDTAEPLQHELISRTPAIVDDVQRLLTGDLSQEVADKLLGGLQASARRHGSHAGKLSGHGLTSG